MGYTHYFSHDEIPVDEWEKLLADFNTLIERSPVSIDLIEAGNDAIHFNGVGDDECEDFLLTRERQDEFCKTNRNNYDLIVAAMLAAAYERGIGVASDGDANDLEWIDAVDYARRKLRRPVPMPVRSS